MKLRNPWIDPRILQVCPEDAQAYLVRHGWKPLGPALNPDLLLFAGPGEGEDGPTVALPIHVGQGPDVQRMIELVGEVASFEDRYAGDVLDELLSRGDGKASPANGANRDNEERALTAAIRRGEEDAEAGKVVSHEEVKKRAASTKESRPGTEES